MELRLNTGLLRRARRRRSHLGRAVVTLGFWLVPCLLVLGLAYLVASRG
ncbi:MAG TPA: hypothetical protein VE596_04710 [Gaiellaceae bacterium]|nr:hypothetical protein [Gaiellaceae bacterium]